MIYVLYNTDLNSLAGDSGVAPIVQLPPPVSETDREDHISWIKRLESGEFADPGDSTQMITLICDKYCINQAQKIKCAGFGLVKFVNAIDDLAEKWNAGLNLVKPY